MNTEPNLKQWQELKADWQDFLKACTRKQRRALSYFLFGKDSSKAYEQYQEICKQIGETWKVTQEARARISKIIEKRDGGLMQTITYQDLEGNDHTRFIYADPYLAGHRRFFAELGPARAKDPLRCAQKLVREREWLEFKGNYKQWLGSNHWWQKIYDLVAFRVVYSFLGDIRDAKKNLRLVLEEVGYHLDQKDYIWNIDEARKRGARSIHLILTTPSPNHRVIEVQLMTTLQVAWDQSEHVIEYEQKRLQHEAAEAPNSKRRQRTHREISRRSVHFLSLSTCVIKSAVSRICQPSEFFRGGFSR